MNMYKVFNLIIQSGTVSLPTLLTSTNPALGSQHHQLLLDLLAAEHTSWLADAQFVVPSPNSSSQANTGILVLRHTSSILHYCTLHEQYSHSRLIVYTILQEVRVWVERLCQVRSQ